jgi:hypothetical protein
MATDGQFGLHAAVDMGLTPSQTTPNLDGCIDSLWVIAFQAPPIRGWLSETVSAWFGPGFYIAGGDRTQSTSQGVSALRFAQE